MNALPCQSDVGGLLLDQLADDALRDERIRERANVLATEYLQDLEWISDAFSDITVGIAWYRETPAPLHNHPLAHAFLTLIRDGSNDAELGRMLRSAVDEALRDLASRKAEAEDMEDAA